MAVPKKKVSSARRDKRRSNNSKMVAPTLVACKNCGALIQAHRVCPKCGYYKKEEIVHVEEA